MRNRPGSPGGSDSESRLSPAPKVSDSADVAVIGAGYVGLTTAVCLAHVGHRVCCGEADAEKVRRLERGEPTIVEAGLAELLREGIDSGRLRFVVGAAAAVEGAEAVFICVPTPGRPDGTADVSAIEDVTTEMAPHLRYGAVVVNKSTVPVGSTLLVERLLERPDVSVVSNPEFLREGSAVHDALHPDRIVVGADDQGAAARVGALYSSLRAPLIVTDPATAETIKYASNAFLATKLSFINAVARLCEVVGAEVRDVLLGMGYDPRIGFDYLRPGPGWGGSCLPKDTRAILYMAESAGYEFPILREVLATNDAQISSVLQKIGTLIGGPVTGEVVAVWGLTFKAGTDDRRDSPAAEIVRRLADAGASIRVFDPTVRARVPELPDSVQVHVDAYAACEGAKVLAVLTEWEEFRWLDFGKVKELLALPQIVDARNLLDPVALRRMGFSYVGVGRR
ncbi:MAG: UDP-glucose dehydrogenase family protein [Acidimicrobiales bacterium]